jgi:hypothetical protein
MNDGAALNGAHWVESFGVNIVTTNSHKWFTLMHQSRPGFGAVFSLLLTGLVLVEGSNEILLRPRPTPAAANSLSKRYESSAIANTCVGQYLSSQDCDGPDFCRSGSQAAPKPFLPNSNTMLPPSNLRIICNTSRLFNLQRIKLKVDPEFDILIIPALLVPRQACAHKSMAGN